MYLGCSQEQQGAHWSEVSKEEAERSEGEGQIVYELCRPLLRTLAFTSKEMRNNWRVWGREMTGPGPIKTPEATAMHLFI